MLKQLLEIDVDVSVVVLAVEDGLSAAIFATSDVELELSPVKDLVIAVEWAEEDLGCLNSGVHLGGWVVTGVEVVRTCHC